MEGTVVVFSVVVVVVFFCFVLFFSERHSLTLRLLNEESNTNFQNSPISENVLKYETTVTYQRQICSVFLLAGHFRGPSRVEMI